MNVELQSANTFTAIIVTVAILILVTLAILSGVRRGRFSPRGGAIAILTLGGAVIALLALVIMIHAQLLM